MARPPSARLDQTILISTKQMRGVRIDPTARPARVRAGALWQDVTGPAAIYGLAPLAGTAGDVGVVGYTLGGGVSWLGRPRLRLQQRHGDRARDRRRSLDPHRRRPPTPSSSGPCAAATRSSASSPRSSSPSTPPTPPRRRPDLPGRARGGDLRRLARVDDHTLPGRGHVLCRVVNVLQRPRCARAASSSRP